MCMMYILFGGSFLESLFGTFTPNYEVFCLWYGVCVTNRASKNCYCYSLVPPGDLTKFQANYGLTEKRAVSIGDMRQRRALSRVSGLCLYLFDVVCVCFGVFCYVKCGV